MTTRGEVTEFTRRHQPGERRAGWHRRRPRRQPVVHRGRRRTASAASRPAGVVTEFRTGISPRAPSGDHRRPRRQPLVHGAAAGNRIGRITPAGVVTEFCGRHQPRERPLEHRRGPRRQPVVHPARCRPHRAHHARGRDHRVLGRHHRRRPADSGSRRVPTATSGSPSSRATASGGSPRPGVVTEFSAGISPGPGGSAHWGSGSYPFGITTGPDGNLWFTEYTGDRIGRITPQGVISEYPPTAAIGRVSLRGTRAVRRAPALPAGGDLPMPRRRAPAAGLHAARRGGGALQHRAGAADRDDPSPLGGGPTPAADHGRASDRAPTAAGSAHPASIERMCRGLRRRRLLHTPSPPGVAPGARRHRLTVNEHRIDNAEHVVRDGQGTRLNGRSRRAGRRRRARAAALVAALMVLLVVVAAGCGGPERAEPTTPEQLAVTRPIRELFSALSAGDAARACAQLTRSARNGRQPVLQGNGWLNCTPRAGLCR